MSLTCFNPFLASLIPPFFSKTFSILVCILLYIMKQFILLCAYCIAICNLLVSYFNNAFAHTEGQATFASIQRWQISLYKAWSICFCRETGPVEALTWPIFTDLSSVHCKQLLFNTMRKIGWNLPLYSWKSETQLMNCTESQTTSMYGPSNILDPKKLMNINKTTLYCKYLGWTWLKLELTNPNLLLSDLRNKHVICNSLNGVAILSSWHP